MKLVPLLQALIGLLGLSSPVYSKSEVADTKFSVSRGYQRGPVELEIHTKTMGAEIRFTTNGSVPTPTHGFVYRSPIRVSSTTVIRAAAFKDGMKPTDVDTQTYLFTRDVLEQTGFGHAVTWGKNEGRPVPADYEMDPDVVKDPGYRDAMVPALEALPVVSISVDPGELFGETSGIYANPMQTGEMWERASAVECFGLPGGKGFHVRCGLRIQGGWNRRPDESPKHALRLVFRKRYGTERLKFDLFGGGNAEFETLVLRAGCNNTWLHWSGVERRRGDYLRDQWMRETYSEMGRASARGLFVHLYLNGLYWGIYNLVERPAAHFAAGSFGGVATQYDSRNGNNVLAGDEVAWQRVFELANAGLEDAGRYREVSTLVDLPAFADYMLLNVYGANGDWDRVSNWYAARRREPAGPYRFFVWDGERTLEGVDDDVLKSDDDLSPTRLFQRLRSNGDFRKLFAERARTHLEGDGVLTPASAARRYQRWAVVLDGPILCESARWGDYRRDVHQYKEGPYELYTRDGHWRPEVERLLKVYFPARTGAVIRQLRAVGLYEPGL